MDAESADLLATFEGLVASLTENAEGIEALARAQGLPIGLFAETLNSIRAQIQIAQEHADFIRNGGLD